MSETTNARFKCLVQITTVILFPVDAETMEEAVKKAKAEYMQHVPVNDVVDIPYAEVQDSLNIEDIVEINE